MQEGSGGAAITNVRIRDGRRLNIPSSYLYPVMDQANLTVLTGAYVNRLTIEGNAVTGVEFEWQNEVRRIKASNVRLQLCAGIRVYLLIVYWRSYDALPTVRHSGGNRQGIRR
jgi:choline dehydrogenase-like flavoprotein